MDDTPAAEQGQGQHTETMDNQDRQQPRDETITQQRQAAAASEQTVVGQETVVQSQPGGSAPKLDTHQEKQHSTQVHEASQLVTGVQDTKSTAAATSEQQHTVVQKQPEASPIHADHSAGDAVTVTQPVVLRSHSNKSLNSDQRRSRLMTESMSRNSLDQYGFWHETCMYSSRYAGYSSLTIPADISTDVTHRLVTRLLSSPLEHVLCCGDSGFCVFVEQCHHRLTSLDLSAINITAFTTEQLNALMANISQFSSLESLNLSHCGFSQSSHVQLLASALQQL